MPAAPPLPAELGALLRRARPPYLWEAAPDVLAAARPQRWEPADSENTLVLALTSQVTDLKEKHRQ